MLQPTALSLPDRPITSLHSSTKQHKVREKRTCADASQQTAGGGHVDDDDEDDGGGDGHDDYGEHVLILERGGEKNDPSCSVMWKKGSSFWCFCFFF